MTEETSNALLWGLLYAMPKNILKETLVVIDRLIKQQELNVREELMHTQAGLLQHYFHVKMEQQRLQKYQWITKIAVGIGLYVAGSLIGLHGIPDVALGLIGAGTAVIVGKSQEKKDDTKE